MNLLILFRMIRHALLWPRVWPGSFWHRYFSGKFTAVHDTPHESFRATLFKVSDTRRFEVGMPFVIYSVNRMTGELTLMRDDKPIVAAEPSR